MYAFKLVFSTWLKMMLVSFVSLYFFVDSLITEIAKETGLDYEWVKLSMPQQLQSMREKRGKKFFGFCQL